MRNKGGVVRNLLILTNLEQVRPTVQFTHEPKIPSTVYTT
jgi:hypothetical protein